MKTCCRCGESYPLSMYRRDPSKRDGHYPACRLCTATGPLFKVIRRRRCPGCGTYFRPRHNKGLEVRHCSRRCATDEQAWSGEKGGTWVGDNAGYYTAHARVRSRLGPATDHRCIDCGDQAAQWSVNRDALRLRFEDGMPYSSNPEDYEARCVSCHKTYDLARLQLSPG